MGRAEGTLIHTAMLCLDRFRPRVLKSGRWAHPHLMHSQAPSHELLGESSSRDYCDECDLLAFPPALADREACATLQQGRQHERGRRRTGRPRNRWEEHLCWFVGAHVWTGAAEWILRKVARTIARGAPAGGDDI